MIKNCMEILERDFSFKRFLYNFFVALHINNWSSGPILIFFYQISLDFPYRIGYSIDIAYGMDKNMKGK